MQYRSLLYPSLVVLTITASHSCEAQVNDQIRGEARSNSNSGSSSQGSSNQGCSSQDTYTSYDYESNAYQSYDYYNSGWESHSLFASHAAFMGRKREEGLHRIRNFAVELPVGSMASLYTTYIPRFTYTAGFIGFEFRQFINVEKRITETDVLQITDFQWLQLNIINLKHYGLRIGIGTMTDPVSAIYRDLTIRQDIYLNKHLDVSTEYRSASRDFFNARREVNGSIGYSFVDSKRFRVSARMWGMHCVFYQKIDFWNAGISLRAQVNH